MKWEGNRQSNNVEDRRGAGGFGLGGRSIGIGTVIVALVGGLMFGIDPLTMLSIMSGGGGTMQEQGPAPAPPPGDTRAAFVSTVLADTEDVWTAVMQRNAVPLLRLSLYCFAEPSSHPVGREALRWVRSTVLTTSESTLTSIFLTQWRTGSGQQAISHRLM